MRKVKLERESHKESCGLNFFLSIAQYVFPYLMKSPELVSSARDIPLSVAAVERDLFVLDHEICDRSPETNPLNYFA